MDDHRRTDGFRILKFGGTSVSAREGIDVMARVVTERRARGRPVVVVSAFAGTTDRLLALARAAAAGGAGPALEELAERHRAVADALLGDGAPPVIEEMGADLDALHRLVRGAAMLGECSPRTLDQVLSFGERLSARIVAAALAARGVPASPCDARELVVTDGRHGEAAVDLAATAKRARRHLAKADEADGGDGGSHPPIPIVTGFIGATPDGDTTTLGRGASDLTAAVLGAVLDAEAVEIWTDVPGVMSADPRDVPEAFPLSDLSYDELLELSHWGARVVHPAAVRPLRERGIPLHILNTLDPAHPGSSVTGEGGSSEERPVRGVASVGRAVLVQVQGSSLARPSVVSRLFSTAAASSSKQLFVSQGSSERSVCFALRPEATHAVVAALREEFALELRSGKLEDFRIEEDSSTIAVVGEAMRRRPGIAGRVFAVLGNHGINVRAIAQGSSELNISFAVAAHDRSTALSAIHDAFFSPRPRPAELFLAGVGNVGSAFLEQLVDGGAERHRLVLAGIARRGRAVVDTDGIDGEAWREALAEGGGDLDGLVEAALASGRHPRIFVDLTGSPEPVAHYERLLRAGVAVVTANKVGFSGALDRYRRLEAAAAGGARFYHETTAGAALPVLGTLGDLLRTGDEIESLDGVLSGSLGWVFDRLMAGTAFSDAVREARTRGYTEPDPRDDLSGLDVARKLLILARQAGLPLEPSDVEVEAVLAADRWAGLDSEEFWKRLPELDGPFDDRRARAAAAGRRLVFLARLEGGRAHVRVEEVEPDHPCWSLRGTENLVAIHSWRYRDVPLVVRGPGAGPDVTAAGVMADVLRARTEAGDVPAVLSRRARPVTAHPR